MDAEMIALVKAFSSGSGSGSDGLGVPVPADGDVGKVPVVQDDLSYALKQVSGGSETWVHIGDYTLTAEDAAAESAPQIIFTQDVDGNEFACDMILITGKALTSAKRTLYGTFGAANLVSNANYILSAGDLLQNNNIFSVEIEIFQYPYPHAHAKYVYNESMNGGNVAKVNIWRPTSERYFDYPIKRIRLNPSGQLLEGSYFSVWGRVANV